MTYENPWLYQSQPILTQPKSTFGFVYCITDKLTNRKYIGKKQFKFTRKLKPKDKKRTSFESDWKDYYGSSIELQNEVAVKGRSNFIREIISFAHSKGELNYLEAMIQFELKVLESDIWINQSINKYKKLNISHYGEAIETARDWTNSLINTNNDNTDELNQP